MSHLDENFLVVWQRGKHGPCKEAKCDLYNFEDAVGTLSICRIASVDHRSPTGTHRSITELLFLGKVEYKEIRRVVFFLR